MASNASNHRYENISIGENNVVHLGDQRVTNKKEFNIQTAYLFLQEELDLPALNIENAIPSTRLRQLRSNNSSLKGKRTPEVLEPSSDAHRPESAQSVLHRGHAHSKTPGLRGGLQRLTGQLSERARSLAWMRQLSPQVVSRADRQDTLSVGSSDSSDSCAQNLIQQPVDPASNALIQPGQEFLALLTFVLSCLIGRNASQQEMSAFLTKCQRDPFLPLLTAALAFGIARYVQTTHVLKNPSCLDELKITLEDAYGVRNLVSMSICSDFSIFKSFLETHYRKAGRKTGEILIKADQFHLTLGSRRGALIDADNWRVEAGANIVNSLYVVTDDQKCLLCKNALLVSKTGDLHCLQCNGFFRDYDVLRPRAFKVKEALAGVPYSSQQKTAADDRFTELSDYVEYLDDSQIELEGLQHIDIRIAPARGRMPRAQQTEMAYNEAVAEMSAQSSGSKYHRSTHWPGVIATTDTPFTSRHSSAFLDPFEGQEGKRRETSVRHKSQQQVADEDAETAEPSQSGERDTKLRSILKQPRRTPFPEDSDFLREGIAPIGQGGKSGIPPGARWTKISRALVSPEVLELANERFEEQEDHVVVLRVLVKEEIQRLADRTREIGEARQRAWDQDFSENEQWTEQELDEQKARPHSLTRLPRVQQEIDLDGWPRRPLVRELSPYVRVREQQDSPVISALDDDAILDPFEASEDFEHEFALVHG